MRAVTALVAILALAGCTTTVPVTTVEMPTPPATLMVPPQKLTAIPATTTDPKAVLQIIITNNAAAINNSDELTALQNWLTQTAANLKSGGKKQ